ncbi:MAG: rhomboid family intramembrane serine protease [Muribaculaceae bacterium]|nr:rhomboid family intramembrane serine protease [Muribaculaceae bacterium]MDE5976009.1 rhomboid family intramembrane serine protease [Muribaculaceae bacterium]
MAAIIDKFTRYCGSRMLAALIACNVGVFLILLIATIAGNREGVSGNFSMPWLCVSSSTSIFLAHPWTLVTYMVTQYGFLHLFFNMLWLFWFGRFLLTTLSDRHLAFLYFGGGLTGGILFVAIYALFPGLSPAPTYLTGASAAVLSVMTASAVRTPDLRLMLFIFGEVKLKWVAIAAIVLTLLGVGGGNSGGQAAHVGGVLFGLAFSLLLKRGIDLSSRMRVTALPSRKKERKNVVRDANAVARAAAGRLSDTERLDFLLDKIRISGYASLSGAERRELNALSKKLN